MTQFRPTSASASIRNPVHIGRFIVDTRHRSDGHDLRNRSGLKPARVVRIAHKCVEVDYPVTRATASNPIIDCPPLSFLRVRVKTRDKEAFQWCHRRTDQFDSAGMGTFDQLAISGDKIAGALRVSAGSANERLPTSAAGQPQSRKETEANRRAAGAALRIHTSPSPDVRHFIAENLSKAFKPRLRVLASASRVFMLL